MLLTCEPTTSWAIEGRRTTGDVAGARSLTERRRGLRVRQARPVKIFEPVTARYFGGQTEDISSTGLRVELPASSNVRPGAQINVHVGISEGGLTLANRRQMMPALVVWVRRDVEGGLTRLTAGVEFLAGIAARLDAA